MLVKRKAFMFSAARAADWPVWRPIATGLLSTLLGLLEVVRLQAMRWIGPAVKNSLISLRKRFSSTNFSPEILAWT